MDSISLGEKMSTSDRIKTRLEVDGKRYYAADNISRYLANNTDVNNLHNLLSKTNRLWNLFSKDTNLRKDYQLNSLFVDWESSLGISKKI